MSISKRGRTKYPGVTFRWKERLDGSGDERVYYIRYRRGGRGFKEIEEPVGRESQGMTAAKANKIRAMRAAGVEQSNTERRAEDEAARLSGNGPLTFARLWMLYQDVNSGKTSIVADASRYHKHIEGRIASQIVEELTTSDVDSLRASMTRKGLAPQTVKHVLALVRRLIRFGIKRGLCTMPGSLHFEMPKVDNECTESLTDEQLAAYLKALDDEPDQDAAGLLRLALVTGMRKGALLALRWTDCDFERGIITLQGESAKSGKTSQIPMTTAARAILGAVERTASPYVFPGKDGGQRQDFRRMARRVRDNAGLPKDFRPLHGLRHAYASMLISSGKVDLYSLQKLLTHSNPAMTQRYSHLRDDALRKAASAIDDCMNIDNAEK